MLLNVILLSLSSSVDSFGIGITYGLRKLKISNISKFVLCVISIIATSFAILVGSNLSYLLTPLFTKLLGSFILITIGFTIIFQILKSKKPDKQTSMLADKNEQISQNIEKKVYKFFIKFLGITIQIIKDPISSDFDSSSKIDTKEAFYLGIALSIDSFCIGIGSSILGFNLILFPILVAIFQLIFLSIGTIIGKNLNNASKIPNNIWNLISAILLIIIGFSRLFF